MSLGDLVAMTLYPLVCIVLASAALSDLRTRHASDTHWIVLCILGIPSMALYIGSVMGASTSVCYLCGSTLLSMFILSERVTGLVSIMVVALGTMCLSVPVLSGVCGGENLLTIPATVILSVAVYRCGARVGGADIKCVVTLATLFPMFPTAPLIWVPTGNEGLLALPIVSILFVSLVITMGMVFPNVHRNLRDHTLSRNSLSTYTVVRDRFDPVREVAVEDVGNGRIRVMPLVPFLVPLAASTVLVSVVGNPVLALI